MDMLSTLAELEVAVKLIDESNKLTLDNPIDSKYESLKTKLEPIDPKSDTFKMIEQYMQNTHAPTHSGYKLKLLDVFEVDRDGEKSRFKKELDNHQLLWHGSRLTNFMGILSQGLRIAPPEAPATGYMFGKGVYFADSVSKSANYCFTSHNNNRGILLLSEVALGKMRELLESDYVTDLPSDDHQSVKGVGSSAPDSTKKIILEGQVEVPMGNLKQNSGHGGYLMYNEYIVYDVAQINIKYLLVTEFDYKY
jgi:poly [ADP-ribose] polymerase